MKDAKNPRNGGYSLIEVLIAFVIMASVLAVLLPSNTSLYTAIPRIQNRLLAQDYAQSRLATLGVSRPLVVGADQGVYRDRWVWQENVSPRPDLDINGQILEVEIIILSVSTKTELTRFTILRVTNE